MSTLHHSSDQETAHRLFSEVLRQAAQQPAKGGSQGDITIAADPKLGIVRIYFTKPIMCLALDKAAASQMAGLLLQCVKELP
jgi:hypothetical protein